MRESPPQVWTTLSDPKKVKAALETRAEERRAEEARREAYYFADLLARAEAPPAAPEPPARAEAPPSLPGPLDLEAVSVPTQGFCCASTPPDRCSVVSPWHVKTLPNFARPRGKPLGLSLF